MRVLAITLVGLALRLLQLSRLGDLEFDEIVSVTYAALPAAELFPRLASALFEHPPAYYLALGWWRDLAGAGDIQARLLSVYPGTLLIPLVYAAGRRAFGRRAGEAAALLVALSPLPLFYSREARMYAWVATLAVASFWLYARALARPRGWGHWLAYAAVCLVAVFVHYAGLLVVLAQAVSTLVLGRETRRRLRPVLAALGIAGTLALGWALSASGLWASLPALDTAHAATALPALWAAWQGLAAGPERLDWTTALAGAALLGLVIAGVSRLNVTRLALLTTAVLTFLAVLVPIALGKPVQARYLLPAAPFLLILAGNALARAGRGTVAPLAATVIVFGFAPFWADYYGSYQRADYSAITARIASLERPNDAILLTGPWQAWYFDYYYRGGLSHSVLPKDAPPALDPEQARVELEALTAPRSRLWLIQAGLAQADPTNYVERWLRQHAWPAQREAHRNAVLSLFALHPPDSRRPLRQATFGGLIRLSGGWVDGEEVPAADVVRLTLEFEALGTPDTPYKGSLRLVGADGQRVSADFDLLDHGRDGRPTTGWLPGERVVLRQGVWLPASTNPQPYDVRLVVYDARTLAPVLPDPEAGIEAGPGGEVPVGAVYVTQSRASLGPPPGSFEPIDHRFGGGDEFDAIRLTGLRWHQPDPSAGPLVLDLLWQLEGVSGTPHLSRLSVVDSPGRTWLSETRPLFAGAFNMRDWREGEVLGERRSLDLSSVPDGRYALVLRLVDGRGRLLPVAGRNGEVELRRFELPYRHPLRQRLEGASRRLLALLPR